MVGRFRGRRALDRSVGGHHGVPRPHAASFVRLPGKRNRSRKGSHKPTASDAKPAPSSGPEQSPGPGRADAAAPLTPVADRDVAPHLGARVAILPARLLGSNAGRVVVGYLAVALAFNVAAPAPRTAPPAGAAVVASLPDASADWPPADWVYEPLAVLEDPPPKPPRSVPIVRDRPPPDDVGVASVDSDGWPALVEALSLAPAPSRAVQAELTSLALDPALTPTESAERWARSCEPALLELERAARAKVLLVPAGEGSPDVARLHGLGVAALLSAWARVRAGAPALAAPRVLAVVRIGHGLMSQPDPVDSAGGAALARTAERWLEVTLARDDWSAEELAWLRTRLLALQGVRDARALPAGPAQTVSTWVEDKLARMIDDEAKTFERLLLSSTASLETGGGK